jgi:hypothetical protein
MMTSASCPTVDGSTREKLSWPGWQRPPNGRLTPMPAPMQPPDEPHFDVQRLIDSLDRHNVDYLVCGGSAAVAHGASRPTMDLDCVVRRADVNLARLAGVLEELNARLRVAGMSDDEARQLPVEVLATLRQLETSTWMTDAGPFDVLSGLRNTHGELLSYEALLPESERIEGAGFDIPVVSLHDLIASKEQANRPKDHAALVELRRLSEDPSKG